MPIPREANERRFLRFSPVWVQPCGSEGLEPADTLETSPPHDFIDNIHL